MEKCFKTNNIDLIRFKEIIENISSDIFLFILIFLMDKKPFSKKTIKEYEGRKFTSNSIKINRTPILKSKLIVSPNLHSKFSPSVTISKSPIMKKKVTFNLDDKKETQESKNLLMKFAKNTSKKDITKNDLIEDELKMKSVNRKERNNFQNLNSKEIKNNANNMYADLPIVPGIKHKGISNDKLETYKYEFYQ
jgi:hypothetical protein